MRAYVPQRPPGPTPRLLHTRALAATRELFRFKMQTSGRRSSHARRWKEAPTGHRVTLESNRPDVGMTQDGCRGTGPGTRDWLGGWHLPPSHCRGFLYPQRLLQASTQVPHYTTLPCGQQWFPLFMEPRGLSRDQSGQDPQPREHQRSTQDPWVAASSDQRCLWKNQESFLVMK